MLQHLPLLRQFAIFCGAGISFHSGVPLARNIVRHCIAQMGGAADFIDKVEALAIPFEAIMEVFIKNGNSDKLLDIFDIGRPNTNHRWIAKMAKHRQISLVVTTNFDTLIEQALIAEGLVEQQDFVVLRSMNMLAGISWDSHRFYLVKIHGSIDDRSDLGITLEHVASHEQNSHRNAALIHTFSAGAHAQVLVLGYSCSDAFDITPYLEQLPAPHKPVIYINHHLENTDFLQVEDITAKATKNPFRSFHNSQYVTCNTDRLVEHIWRDALPSEPYLWDKQPLEHDWRQMIDQWAAEKTDSDRFFILAALASFIQDYDLVKQFYTECIACAEREKDGFMAALALSNLGINFFHQKAYDLAAEHLERSIEFYQQLKLDDSLANQLGWLGGIYDHHHKNHPEAIRCYREAIMVYEKTGNKRGIGNQLGNIGNSFQLQGNPKAAVEYWLQALQLAQETGNVVGELNQFERLGHYFYELSDYNSALIYLKKGLNLARLIGRRDQETIFSERIAYAYDAVGDFQSAYNYFGQAQLGAIEENKPRQIVDFTMALGSFCERVSNYDLAIQHFEETARLAEQHLFPEQFSEAHISLANIYFNRGRYETGLSHIDTALQKSDYPQYNAIQKRAYTSRGIALLNMGDAPSAIDAFQKSIELEGNTPVNANTHCNLALAYLEKGDIQEGHKTATLALAIAQKNQHKIDIGFASGVLGMACFQLKDFENARKHQALTLQIAIETADVRRQVIVLGEQALLEMEAGQFYAAYRLYRDSLQRAFQNRIHVFVAIRELDLGNLFFGMGHYLLAQEYLQKALHGFMQFNPPDEINIKVVKGILSRIQSVLEQRGDQSRFDTWMERDIHHYWPFFREGAEAFHQAYLNNGDLGYREVKSIADWHYALRQYELALELYQVCLTNRPDDLTVLNSAGNVAFALKNWNLAHQYFSRACVLEPAHGNANYLLGHIYNKWNKPDLSAEHYEKSLEQHPDNRHALYNLGLCYLNAKSFEKAEYYFGEAVKIEPRDAEALFALGALAYARNSVEDALRYYERSYQVNPNQENLLEIICEIYMSRMNAPERTVYYMEQLLAFRPNDPELLFKCAIGYHEQLKKPDQARALYEKLLAIEPAFDRANYCYALLLVDYYSDYPNALKYYGEALRLNPQMYQAHHNLGLLWSEKLHDIEKAKFHYQASLGIVPQFYLSNWKYGELLIQKEQAYEAGVRHILIALRENPSMLSPRILLAQVLLEHFQDYPEAEHVCRDALNMDSGHPVLWYLLGRALLYQQKHSEGLQALQQAVSINPNMKPFILENDALKTLLSEKELAGFM